MAKDQPGFGKKLRGFLFRRDDRDRPVETEVTETPSEPDTAVQPEEKPEQSCPVVPEEKQATYLPVESGELMELWHRWRPEEPLCGLDLAESGGELPLNEQELIQEKQRLSAALERDAGRRLSELRALELNAETEDGLPEEAKALDADCRIYLSGNRLVAWAFAFPPCGAGQDVTYELVAGRMQEEHVTTGIDTGAVSRLFQERTYFRLIPIALGKAAEEGENGRIEDHFYRELPVAVKINENGVADYRDIHYIQVVEENQTICEIIPPREGEAGLRVDGVVIQPEHVKPAKPPKGRNTAVDPEGKRLVATRGGHLEFSKDAFHVKSVLEVEGDVDYSTGNIDFNGDVHVHGDVRENFHVRATGGVSVDGLVEAATVEAGGDIIIASGVQGNFKAVLKSKGSIRAKFLENCVAYARKGIMADSIVACQVFSDDFIEATSGRGAIIGGELTAACRVKANLVGSQAGRKTKVRLGAVPCVEEEIRENVNSLDEVRAEMMQLDAKLDLLAECEGMEDGSKELSRAQLRKSALSLREMQLLKERSRLNLTEPDLTRCRLEASVLYPITRVEIGNCVLNVEQVRNSCKIKYDPQECRVVVV